jgi:SAM-dependent methyltransferase
VARLPIVEPVLNRPVVRHALHRTPWAHLLYARGWDRRHPFDRRHGTDTSGKIAIERLTSTPLLQEHGVFYAGSQPSVARAGLNALPPLDGFTFVDVGCGKGRVVLVAAEYPFARIVGIDLSNDLLEVARRNAALVRREPSRPAVEFIEADATTFEFPAGDLVVYLYHPFDAPLMERVVAQLERAIARQPRRVYVVYCNPVAGHCFDASPHFTRCFAETVAYGDEDLGFGPDVADSLVIWQAGTVPPPASTLASAVDIVVTTPRRRAVLRRRA